MRPGQISRRKNAYTFLLTDVSSNVIRCFFALENNVQKMAWLEQQTHYVSVDYRVAESSGEAVPPSATTKVK